MANSNCTGIIHVNEYIRNGFPVEAYDRKCGRHNPHKKNLEDWRRRYAEENEGFAPASEEDGQENNENDESEGVENDSSGEEAAGDETENNEEGNNEDDKNALLEAAFAFITNGEGFVPGIYADIKGNLTVGYGTNVNDFGAFSKVEFRDSMSHGHILSMGEKATLFDKAQSEKMCVNWGVSGERQTLLNDLAFMTKNEATAQAKESINISLKEVQGMAEREGVNFNALPPSAKVGILDMHYNMGGGKFNPSTFPSFFGALKQGDFTRAGRESHRKDIGEKRNIEVRKKFDESRKEKQHYERYGTWR